MSDELLLAGAMLFSIAGFAWLALAMDAHWQQVRGSGRPAPRARIRLRVAGGIALLLSLILCNLPDHATIASLVWVMSLSAGALLVALTLAWRPGLLRVPWTWDDRSTKGIQGKGRHLKRSPASLHPRRSARAGCGRAKAGGDNSRRCPARTPQRPAGPNPR
jgi:hypothetical protein